MSSSEPEMMADGEARVVESAQARVLPHSTVMLTLLRREVWEHRSLWLAPLAVTLFLVLSAAITSPGISTFNFSINGQPGLVSVLGGGSARMSLALFGLVHWAMSLPLYLLLAMMASFYLTDCLYAERRDRSILFWKSLPVSDLSTVASKALVGMVLLPLGVYLLAVLTDALLCGAWYLRGVIVGSETSWLPWSTVNWLKVQALLGLGTVLSMLWLAPLGGYLLVVSAWARRNALMWSSLPPLLAPLLERQMFGTTYLWNLLTFRTFGLWYLPGVVEARAAASVPLSHMSPLSPVSPVELFDALPVGRVFANIHLWLGVLAALALVYLAARIRRHRDEASG